MPIIRIELLEGRTDYQKRELIAQVTEAAENALHVDRNTVRVIVNEVRKTDWAIGGRTMTELEQDTNR